MNFEIKNRFTGEVQFTAEIECAEDTLPSIKIGLAVKWAIKMRANLAGAYLADAYLARANLAGAYLADAYLARANLARANLADAYLARANLDHANLAGAYLARAYLADAYFAHANLARAYLAGAYLARANLADALKIDDKDIPVIPNIDAEILKAIEAGGKLDMGSWHGPQDHWCGTTHCRAGWAIHIAGKKGKELQDRVGPQMAGTLIYYASRPGQPSPWFFAGTDEALADIRRCAAEQTAMSEGN
jgi:tetratricopeptide (TPR) repeat protein